MHRLKDCEEFWKIFKIMEILCPPLEPIPSDSWKEQVTDEAMKNDSSKAGATH